MSKPIPFTYDEVQSAFPEFVVVDPHVGSGDQKVAYRATSGSTNLALKILLDGIVEDPDDEAEDFAERFRRELQGMASTTCPYVINVVDEPQSRTIGAVDYLWYSEPFLQGGTLRARLKANNRLSPEEVQQLAECLLAAVHAMWHEGHFVHRDLKPGNIGFNVAGNAVVIDLGIALFRDMAPVTQSSLTSPGTQFYAAPEQYELRRNAEMDFRTDLFQVGIVLFESLTGSHPFRGSAHYMDALNSFDPKVLDSVQMSDGLRLLITRCLASKPNRRPRTVDRAIEMLRGV